MNPIVPTEPIENRTNQWSALLSKYSTIWIWSIITGLNSSLFFSFFNSRWNNYGLINLMIITFNVCAIIISLMAWFELYKVLRGVILPNILDYKPEGSGNEEYIQKAKRMAYYSISRAFYFTMFAVAIKSFAFIIEGAFNALKN